MSAIKKIGKGIGHVEDWITIISFLLMTIVVVVIVLCRYVFKVSFMQGEEIARYLMIWCAYSGAAYGFRTHAHVGVVVFAEMLPKKAHPYIEKIRHILSFLIVVGLFIFAVMCLNKYISTGQLTTTTRVPTAFVYGIIPFAMALSIIHTAVDIINDFIPKKEKDNDAGKEADK